MSNSRGILTGAALTLCIISVWILLYTLLLSAFQEARSQTILYGDMRQSLALQTAPLGGTIAPGMPVALLSAPTLNMDQTVVVEGTASGDLMAGPGHRRDTVLPGQIGVSVLYGRASMFGGPFRGLTDAKPGDPIIAVTGQGTFTYVVEDVRREGQDLPQPLAAGQGRITLATTEGTGFLGAWHPSGVLYVDAKLKGDAQQYPPGKPFVVPRSEMAMQGDPSALLPLALSLPVLIAVLIGTLWAWRRWGGWQAWLVGLPIVVASLWLVSIFVVRLLPNLI